VTAVPPEAGAVQLSVHTPCELTDEYLGRLNRLHGITHPSRPGGVYEPERNPGGCDNAFCCAILPEVLATVEPAIRADERERILTAFRRSTVLLNTADGTGVSAVPWSRVLEAIRGEEAGNG
jgi:hypothetical protein